MVNMFMGETRKNVDNLQNQIEKKSVKKVLLKQNIWWINVLKLPISYVFLTET